MLADNEEIFVSVLGKVYPSIVADFDFLIYQGVLEVLQEHPVYSLIAKLTPAIQEGLNHIRRLSFVQFACVFDRNQTTNRIL